MPDPTWPSRIKSPGPKRILSIDGGGVRGALAVGILRHIESLLREAHGRPDMVLSDYFDLIGGTSTGAIIAAGLALGRTTDNLEALYRSLGPEIFRQSGLRLAGVQGRFDPRRLEKVLRQELGNETLEAAAWRTGFCAVAKRVDTGSVWSMTNCPGGRFWNGDPDETDRGARRVIPNKDYSLAKVVQASAAAPFFFDLVPVEVELNRPGVFFDGGITPHGNPVLQLAMTALIPAYGFNWTPGADRLHVVSVGTGAHRPIKPTWVKPPVLAIWKALHALMSMAYDTSQLAITMMQWLGVSPAPWRINSEVGTLQGAGPPGMAPLWTFQRYDAPLESVWLKENLGLDTNPAELARLQKMDNDRGIPRLFEIGLAAGAAQVKAKHFDGFMMLPTHRVANQ